MPTQAVPSDMSIRRQETVSVHPVGQSAQPYLGGGGTGIRTQETLSRLTVFKTAAFSLSAIPPQEQTASSDPNSPRRKSRRLPAAMHPARLRRSSDRVLVAVRDQRQTRQAPSSRPVRRPARSPPAPALLSMQRGFSPRCRPAREEAATRVHLCRRRRVHADPRECAPRRGRGDTGPPTASAPRSVSRRVTPTKRPRRYGPSTAQIPGEP